MAEFSKQWCEKFDPKRIWDFDIEEIANNNLQPEQYVPMICEGYGFIAIGKDEYNGIHLAFKDSKTDNINWVEYDRL